MKALGSFFETPPGFEFTRAYLLFTTFGFFPQGEHRNFFALQRMHERHLGLDPMGGPTVIAPVADQPRAPIDQRQSQGT